MNAEKWVRKPTAGGTAFYSEINPAYVDELEARNEVIERENLKLREAVVKNDELRKMVREYFAGYGEAVVPEEKRMIALANSVAPSPAHKNT